MKKIFIFCITIHCISVKIKMNKLISKTDDVAVVMWLDVWLVMMECTQPPSCCCGRHLSGDDGVYTTPPS